MDEASEGEKERRMRKRMKLVKKVKKIYQASNVMLKTGDCALRVKAGEYATVDVVRGKQNLGAIWEGCLDRKSEKARELEEKTIMRDKKKLGKVLQNRQGSSKTKQKQLI